MDIWMTVSYVLATILAVLVMVSLIKLMGPQNETEREADDKAQEDYLNNWSKRNEK